MHRIYRAEQTPDYKISVTFFNGEVREYDLEGYSDAGDQKARLLYYAELLSDITIDNSRNGLKLSDGTHITGSELYYGGVSTGNVYIDDLNIRFADKFQEIRESLGLTQKDIERISGIQQAEISKIEKGVGNPSLATVVRLGKAVNNVISLDFSPAGDSTVYENAALNDELVKYLGTGKHQGEFTVSDMGKLPEDSRYELIDGCIYDIGTPSMVHQDILIHVTSVIYNFIKGKNGRCKVSSNFGLRFVGDEKNYVVPDIGIICDQNKISYDGVNGAPDFLVEIVSPNNKRNDYYRKLDLYGKRGVREYWIIDPMKKCVVVHDFDNDECPEIHFLNETVSVGIYGDELQIDLNEINAIILQY